MTTSQHAALWNHIHGGNFTSTIVSLDGLPSREKLRRLKLANKAIKGAPKSKVVSKYQAKHNGDNFHNGLYVNCGRACIAQ